MPLDKLYVYTLYKDGITRIMIINSPTGGLLPLVFSTLEELERWAPLVEETCKTYKVQAELCEYDFVKIKELINMTTM